MSSEGANFITVDNYFHVKIILRNYFTPKITVAIIVLMQVYLQAAHRELVGIIELHIKHRPQRLDNVFHFYHPERTFFKKVIELDTEHPLFLHDHDAGTDLAGSREDKRLFTCTSDPEVTCELRSTVRNCE